VSGTGAVGRGEGDALAVGVQHARVGGPVAQLQRHVRDGLYARRCLAEEKGVGDTTWTSSGARRVRRVIRTSRVVCGTRTLLRKTSASTVSSSSKKASAQRTYRSDWQWRSCKKGRVNAQN